MFNRILTIVNIIVGLVLLTVTIVANQDNILSFIRRYSYVAPTILIIALYMIFLVGASYLGRQRQKRRNRLIAIAKTLAELRIYLDRSLNDLMDGPDNYDNDGFFEFFSKEWGPTGESLSDLAVPFPEIESADEFRLRKWSLYVDMLFPFAIRGDLEEARLVLLRVEEKPVDTFRITLERWKFWR